MKHNSLKQITFSDSKLKSIFFIELNWLCQQIIEKSSTLFSQHLVVENSYISANLEALDLVYSILSCASKIQEMTVTNQKQKRHIERADYFKTLLYDLNIQEMFNKKVRNTVEHFAEYLDETNEKHTLYKNEDSYLVAFNLVLSDWQPTNNVNIPFTLYRALGFKDPIYPIRIYIAGERRFYNMDWSISIENLSKEARLIQELLLSRKYIKSEKASDYVSMMLKY